MNDSFNQISTMDRIKNIWYKHRKHIIVALIVLVPGIVFLIILAFTGNNEPIVNNQSYKDIERIMVINSQKYIQNNNVTDGSYIPLNSLNVKIDDKLNCESLSGVYSKDGNYYPYLICDRYESSSIENIKNYNKEKSSFGTLKGSNPMIITNSKYVEPGYEVDPKYTVNVKKSNLKEGMNEITYYINENNKNVGELKRIVIVSGLKGEAPTLELIGSITRTIKEGNKYVETGYKAKDEIDGDLTDKVEVTGMVDTNSPGTYKIKYSVTNSSNKTTTKERTIIVTESDVIDLNATSSLSTTELTNKGVDINFSVNGNGFEKVVLPDNSESDDREIKYTVYKNGTYDFLLYDINGNNESFSVDVKNIDADKPTGTCVGNTKDNVTNLTVDATDEGSGIESYTYVYGEKSVKGNASYKIDSKQTSVKVEVRDKATNVATIECQVEVLPDTPPPPNPESSDGVIAGGRLVSGAAGSSDLITNYLPGNSVDFMNRKIASTAKSSGLYTRSAVVNVATTLINTLQSYNYRIPYQLGGRYSVGDKEWGLNPNWGQYDPSNDRYPRVGLDCRNFVIWVYKQAGLSLVRGFGYEGSKDRDVDNKYSNIQDGRPGDVLDHSDLRHIMLIISKDANGYTIAESNGAGYVRMMYYTFENIRQGGYYAYNMDAVFNNNGMYCGNTQSYRPYPGSCHIPRSAFPSYY